MVSTAAYAGLAILVIGLAVGAYGAVTPVTTTSMGSRTLVTLALNIDPNDYQSANYNLTSGQTVSVYTSIKNNTVFNLDIMDRSQYYTYYGCAPYCHSAANISAGVGTVPPQNLTVISNITVTPSSPYSGSFTAPASGVYYFVFDNTVGQNWGTYVGQNASGFTQGNFTLSQQIPLKSYAANLTVVGIGAVLLIVGGAIATAMWGGPSAAKKPPVKPAAPSPSPPSSPQTPPKM
jgi:hypothetical protein